MEKDWVDFRLIKQAVSLQMVLDHYHINWLRKSGDELRGRCPIHKGEGDRTFHVNMSKGAFNCFSCKARGNVLDLVAAMEQCSVREAALKLKQWFGVGESESVKATPLPKSETQTQITAADKPTGVINPPLSFQLRVDSGHAYGLSRGVSRTTLEYFGAGFCISKGTFSGRFVIPLHNAEEGQLVGYAGRSIDDAEPKYLFPSSEKKGFYKRYLLYNSHRVLEESSDLVVLVEGFFDCFKVKQAGYPVIGLLGSSLSSEQEDLISQHFKRVVLLFDGDDAGKQATDDCLLRLGRRLWVSATSLPSGSQPDQLSEDAIKQLLDPAL